MFGAQAAIVWGSPRLSADVDVTAAIKPETLTDYIDAMSSHGFELAIDDSEFIARTRVLPFVHRTSGMPLDVVLAGPGLEEEFLRRAIRVDVDGTPVPVISPEDLIITKILAGRPKDVEDIRSVIHERRASLDEARIREVLRLLEQALGQCDLLPIFVKEWGDQERESTGAKKGGGRRIKPKGKSKKK
ncbi:MAG TPA: nucleotidyl transferase AbiEii/AbiGii toxin family protein [Thermoanaerobaculia bacterium]